MKFLVLGSTGMAGHTVSLYLHERGHDVTTFSTSNHGNYNNIIGDAMDRDLIVSILKNGCYDVVVNCIGLLNKECDRVPSKAIYLNSYLPHLIADTLSEMSTRLFHLSTDCVFSGKLGPYHENSFRDGEKIYDKSKALGEVEDNKNITFRTSIIGPDMKQEGIGLFNWFMRQDTFINGYTKAKWTGVTTITLAKAIEAAATSSITGIYNLVNNESISKFELLRLLNKYMRNDTIEILPSEEVNLNKSLINNRTDFSFQVPSYEQMIIEMSAWILNHRQLYPHYDVE